MSYLVRMQTFCKWSPLMCVPPARPCAMSTYFLPLCGHCCVVAINHFEARGWSCFWPFPMAKKCAAMIAFGHDGSLLQHSTLRDYSCPTPESSINNCKTLFAPPCFNYTDKGGQCRPVTLHAYTHNIRRGSYKLKLWMASAPSDFQRANSFQGAAIPL